MGPISSDDGEPRYLLDLYICSYTPTLSALIQSRHHHTAGSRSLNRPSILLVAQLNPSLPTVGGEIQAVQALDTEVTSLISEAATPTTVINGFHHHRFVHFACHGTLEGLHLAAAVQYCGFRSVVGTMWAMVDEDGRELAVNFYKTLFSNSRGTQIPYHERSAKALRFAVKKLRRKRQITLERWVNFVHYGA
jgi:CHAT domain-containing protein